MNDTTKEIEEMQRKILMSKTVSERFLMGVEMYEAVKKTVQASLRNRKPGISVIELKVETFRRFYQNDYTKEELNEISQKIQ